MADLLSAIPDDLAWFTIAGAMFLAVFTAVYKGAIIPRPTYEERIADKDKMLAEKDRQIEILLEARKYDRETIRKANEGHRTVIQMLEGMQRSASGDRS